MTTYEVIRDTREKDGHGWVFPKTDMCKGTIIKTLKTGDYTIVGLEDVLCIERKGCVREFVNSLHDKNFKNELERMKEFKHAFVVLEFSFDLLDKWPLGSGIPSYKIPKYLSHPGCALASFWKLQIKYPHVKFLFVGNSGRSGISSLFKRILESK